MLSVTAVFMPLPSISHQSHFVFRLSVHNYMLEVRERDILQSACGNFTMFTTWAELGTKMS